MSEPQTKIIRLDDASKSSLCRNDQEENGIRFLVRLCHDVLLEVVCYGDRRCLTKLERIGRRFHLFANNYFNEKPFLRLDLYLKPTGNGLEAFIFGKEKKKISQSDLAVSPKFIRFGEVELIYRYTELPIAEMCQAFVNCLQPLKRELNGTKLLHFHGHIHQKDRSCFNGQSQLLVHLRDELMPIFVFNPSRNYKFDISFHTEDNNSSLNAVTQILQMAPIDRCSNLEIRLYGITEQLLPVKEILNWLHRKSDRIIEKKKEEERFLRIYSNDMQNARELCDGLKKAFENASFPISPYCLKLEYFGTIEFDEEEMVTVINTCTNEQFSILKCEYGSTIEIKRGAKCSKKR